LEIRSPSEPTAVPFLTVHLDTELYVEPCEVDLVRPGRVFSHIPTKVPGSCEQTDEAALQPGGAHVISVEESLQDSRSLAPRRSEDIELLLEPVARCDMTSKRAVECVFDLGRRENISEVHQSAMNARHRDLSDRGAVTRRHFSLVDDDPGRP